MAVFGANYVAENAMEVFYVREKPVVPQPGDGVIKMPAPGQMQFEEGFKVDVTGHGVTAQRTLKDLPSKDVISCQRRRVRPFCVYSILPFCVLSAHVWMTAEPTIPVAENCNERYRHDLRWLGSRQQKHGSQCQKIVRNQGCH